MQWEYRIEGFNINATPNDTLASKLNALGREGWEIISTGWPDRSFVLMKRQMTKEGLTSKPTSA